jgi:hypothetical protein
MLCRKSSIFAAAIRPLRRAIASSRLRRSRVEPDSQFVPSMRYRKPGITNTRSRSKPASDSSTTCSAEYHHDFDASLLRSMPATSWNSEYVKPGQSACTRTGDPVPRSSIQMPSVNALIQHLLAP